MVEVPTVLLGTRLPQPVVELEILWLLNQVRGYDELVKDSGCPCDLKWTEQGLTLVTRWLHQPDQVFSRARVSWAWGSLHISIWVEHNQLKHFLILHCKEEYCSHFSALVLGVESTWCGVKSMDLWAFSLPSWYKSLVLWHCFMLLLQTWQQAPQPPSIPPRRSVIPLSLSLYLRWDYWHDTWRSMIS